MSKLKLSFLLLPLAAALVFAQSRAGRVDAKALRSAAANGNEWLTYGRDYAETRFSPLKQINASNVGRLGLAWSYDTESVRGLEATPLISNGVMYATGPWSVVYAIDARTGAHKWKFDPEVPRSFGGKACCDVVNRGVALYNNKVFVGTIDGRLIAVDMSTGKQVWSAQTTERGQPETITGAPRVVKGKVIIGMGGSELGVRGHVSAWDAETGKLAWRFYIVPGDPSKPFEDEAQAKAAKTWTGEWWKMGGGGAPWDAIAYDPDADLLYVGTGNGSPWVQRVRSPQGGDNLYLSSIIALKPDTGKLAWHYQTTPGETWDYTAVQQITLADLRIPDSKGGARLRKVLMQAPKNGFFYVLDRVTGELISAEPYTKITWATHVDKKTGRPVETPTARFEKGTVFIYPGPSGGHNWNPMAFNPQTGLMYIPEIRGAFPYSNENAYQYTAGRWNIGVSFAPDTVGASVPAPDGPPGSLLAWDPVAQKARWSIPHQATANGGIVTTAGNLVFQGTADGHFSAYSADKGDKLWDVNLGNGVMAAPSTYMLDGKQYISVMAGWGGATALFGTSGTNAYKAPGRLWTFVLDGGKVEPVKGRALPRATPITSNASPAQVASGGQIYARNCAMCHGNGAVSGGAIADLRYASEATYANLPAIVLDGQLASLGMPSFRPFLNESDAASIRAYLVAQRNELTK